MKLLQQQNAVKYPLFKLKLLSNAPQIALLGNPLRR
jgi:hypothetical protein